MKRIFALIGCAFLFTAAIFAQQTGSIRLRLIESETGAPMAGAFVEVYNTAEPDRKRGFTSDSEGNVTIGGLAYGEYSLRMSYLGYAEVTKLVRVNAATVDIGTIELSEGALIIEGAVIDIPAIRTSIKGDTVSYNAGAFRVAQGADAEGLLAKMPGISVIGGTVEAQGEEVKKVFVDGREFFGGDVTTAIRSLPAEVVDRVEVFNKLSDQAEFTGIDDGEGFKAINIVTTLDKRSGQFGKLYGSYGVPDYYIAGGNVNIFSGDSRLSILGLFNNLNQQNFSFEDIVGATASSSSGSGSRGGRMGGPGGPNRSAFNFLVRPQEGIATVQAVGLNFSDKWGRKNKLEVTGSYFFNHTNTVNEGYTESWFTNVQQGRTEFSRTDINRSESDNMNHRFNALFDYKISEGQNLRIRPSFSLQKYDNFEDKFITRENEANGVSSAIDWQRNVTDSERFGINSGLDILYRTRLGKPGRTISFNLGGNYSLNDRENFPEQYIFLPLADGSKPDTDDNANADTVNNRKEINDSYSYRLNGSVSYTEPLSKKSSLNMEYRANYNYSDSDRRVYLPLGTSFNPDFEEELSNLANSGYLTQRVSPGYRYNGEKINFNINLTYENASLQNTQRFPDDESMTRSFDNVLYGGMLNYNINPSNSFRLFVNSRTNNPSISQLQNVVDNSNLSNMTGGNPGLTPSYQHSLRTFYNKSNTLKGTTFMAMLGGSYVANYIGSSIHTNPDFEVPVIDEPLGEGNRYTAPANMDGYWYAMGRLSYGFPVKFLRSNLNLNLGGMLGQTPSLMDGEKTMTDMRNVDAGLIFSSNISEKIDFTISYTGSYNTTQNMSRVSGSNEYAKVSSRYIMQYLSANVKVVFWKGFTFSTNATYTQNKGLTEDYNDEFIICNVLLGKKIFKNQRGELSLMANDIFDQNTSFRTYVNGTTKTNTKSLAVGRYFGVQFVYNLRIYGKGASRRSSDYDGLDQPSTNRSQGTMMRVPGPGPGMRPGGPPR